MGSERLPNCWDRVYRVQGENGRPLDRMDCADSRTPPRIRKVSEAGAGSNRRRLEARPSRSAKNNRPSPRSGLRLGEKARRDWAVVEAAFRGRLLRSMQKGARFRKRPLRGFVLSIVTTEN